MFPPADDPPDLGIPPNRGPLPVRRTLTLNLTLAFVPAIDTMPGRRGFGGFELTEALYVRFLTCSFIFSALFIVVLMIMHVSLFQECPFLNSNICFQARRILE